MFDAILIANRGEIACRIIRTVRRMGLRAIAVYSDADAEAQHVRLADEAYHIGPSPAAQSYLDGARIIEVARRAGAGAIHPGYGFLSENAEFAQNCARSGLVFIGPPPDAIRAMGIKDSAKALMEKAGVPVVPSYDIADIDDAAAIDYPVLIKAVAGGGGKGMRRVDRAEDFAAALAGARREAAASFGDERVLVEKYLTTPRHIEVQIFADSQGTVVHLFERDCSIQRRHQKVLEEAPAPGLAAEMRARMGAAAVAAVGAIGYQGAGTVEFIVDVSKGLGGAPFYFMEMNTRLQVEHPVTEMITGVDLVEWQLRVAAGEPLPLGQDGLAISGHAIEARLYAEDPARDFLPATGRLKRLVMPAEGPHVRIDSGVREGDQVSVHYDPMIAKLIVWDHDRAAALRRLNGALAALRIAGVTTNAGFLGALARHEAFARAALDTGFIDTYRADLLPEARPASGEVLAFACLDVLLRRQARAADDPSPWGRVDGWRLNDDSHDALAFRDGETEISIMVHFRPQGYVLDLPDGPLAVRGEREPNGDIVGDFGGVRRRAAVVRQDREITVITGGHTHRLMRLDPRHAGEDEAEDEGAVIAPMPGRIIRVLAAVGETVEKGQVLVMLEAMKMEHSLCAPADGVIETLDYTEGDQVEEGETLIVIGPGEGT